MVPKWLPRNRLWVGLSRWGLSGAASVIDARFQELGGEPKVETLDHRAARIERDLNYEKSRENYLRSDEGVQSANESFASLKDAVLEAVPRLQSAAPSLRISVKHQDRQVVLLSDGLSLSINWQRRYINTLNESLLETTIWQGHPPFPGIHFFEEPTLIHQLSLAPDLDPSGTHAWSIKAASGKRLMSGSEAAEHILRWWLDKASKHKGNA